jgi:hypothetical protein
LAFILHSKVHSAVLVDSVVNLDSEVLHHSKVHAQAFHRSNAHAKVIGTDSVVSPDWAVVRRSKGYSAVLNDFVITADFVVPIVANHLRTAKAS